MKLSIILPFYYKGNEFDIALGYNKQYLTDDMELVIPIDEPDSKDEVKQILDKHNVTEYQIRSNPQKHIWRNPSKAINVGLRMARGEYVIVMSPESICVTNVYDTLYRNAFMYDKEKAYFSTGRVVFYKEGITETDNLLDLFNSSVHFWYGSICASKEAFFSVRGYNEAITGWGYDDMEIRSKLQREGYKMRLIEDAMVIHNEIAKTRPKDYQKQHQKSRLVKRKNDENWGMDF